jgi:hypothetical protein
MGPSFLIFIIGLENRCCTPFGIQLSPACRPAGMGPSFLIFIIGLENRCCTPFGIQLSPACRQAGMGPYSPKITPLTAIFEMAKVKKNYLNNYIYFSLLQFFCNYLSS